MSKAPTSRLKQTAWIATLMLSLLFAQFAGLRHRVDHAGWQQQPGQANTDSSVKYGSHNCAIFDAATLADAAGAAPAIGFATDCVYALALSRMLASWDASVLVPFLSRAPPALS